MSPVNNDFPANPATFNVHSEPRVHIDNEPLAGSQGTAPGHDYATDAMEKIQNLAKKDQLAASRHAIPAQEEPRYASTTTPATQGANAFNTERPLDVRPTKAGGVAIGGQEDLPLGTAGMGDKIIGKTQKVIGKYTDNPELHEKGELRETGGKAAAHGHARAAHD